MLGIEDDVSREGCLLTISIGLGLADRLPNPLSDRRFKRGSSLTKGTQGCLFVNVQVPEVMPDELGAHRSKRVLGIVGILQMNAVPIYELDTAGSASSFFAGRTEFSRRLEAVQVVGTV